MRRGQEDDPADERQGLEEEVPAQLVQDRARAEDVVERPVGVEPPELVAARDGHHAAQDAAHAVAEQHHLIERRVAAVGVVHLLGLDQRFAQAGGGDRDRHAGRVHVEQELVVAPGSSGLRSSSLSIGIQASGRGDQPVDHDHRDLARLVGADQEQVGPLEGLLGAEQAGPAIAIEVGARPHVGQRCRQVDLEGDLVAGFADVRGLGRDRRA